MMDWDDFAVEFDEVGHLIQRGRKGWREPICPECDEPIRWVLDMASFQRQSDSSFAMCHARCVWIRAAFDREGKRAPLDH